MKKALSALLALVMAVSLCMAPAMAVPAPVPTKEADSYTGPVIDYPDKELWFDSTVYGGFYSAYQIMAGNGDDTFDVDAFINSKQGELIMSRIRYELALLGDSQYASQTMIDYWAGRGVVEKVYNHDDPEHEWLAYIPDYITNNGSSGKSWPVVFCFHGGGGTLFEATNHGFVDLCYEQGFIVICPENENTNRELSLKSLTDYVAALEGLNTWLKASGCGEAKRADNILGFTADKLYEMEIDGTTYTFAEFYNQAGEKTVVFVGIEDWVHWTPYSYARLSWQLMSQFTNKK